MFRRSAGFTLLELMIVLVILVVVTAFAWPRITGQMQLIGPREAALQLRADLAEARELAVRSGEAWTIRIERGTGSYEIGPVAEFREREALSSPRADGGRSSDAEMLIGRAVKPAIERDDGLRSGLAAPAVLTSIELLELPVGMVFEDGVAHSTREANQIRAVDPNQPSPVQPNLVQPNPSQPSPHQPSNGMLNPLGANHLVPTPLASADTWKYVCIFQPDGRATESEFRLKEQTSEAKIRLRIRGLTGGVTIDGVERKRRGVQQMEGPLDPLADPQSGAGLDGQMQEMSETLQRLNAAGSGVPTSPEQQR